MNVECIDLGNGRWRKRWISKQHLVEYIRCKYRVFLSFSQGVPIQELKQSVELEPILENGLILENKIINKINPQKVFSKEFLESLSTKSLPIKVPKLFRNVELGIQGIPDLIRTNNGKYIPVEIKDHKEVTHIDEIELAFYWLLLAPLRKKKTSRKGFVILNTGEEIAVNISEELLWEVEFLIDELRELVKTGAEPSLTRECKSCLQEKKCRQTVIKSGGLTVLYNVSTVRERHFKSVGITNLSDLMRVDENKLNDDLIFQCGHSPGANELFRMKCHAFSIATGKPFFFGKNESITSLVSSKSLVLDLEYDDEGFIYLVGLGRKTKTRVIFYQFFADHRNLRDEKRILGSLTDFVYQYSSHLLITYGGTFADAPRLRNAWIRQNMEFTELGKILDNHLDLCRWLQERFRFPPKRMGLDDMEEYLGLTRQSSITGGREAIDWYNEYLRTKDQLVKTEIKNELLSYNKDDINSTFEIIGALPALLSDSITI